MKDLNYTGFVFLTRVALTIMLGIFGYVASTVAYNAEGYIMCAMPSALFIAVFFLIGIPQSSVEKPIRISSHKDVGSELKDKTAGYGNGVHKDSFDDRELDGVKRGDF